MFSTNCIPGREQSVLEVHHQRREETYTFGRGGMRALEVNLGKHIVYTRITTHPHHTYALTNERSYAQGNQYTYHDQSPPNQYTRRTSTTVTTPNQYTITHSPPRTLIRVSDARGRVLCSNATAKTTKGSTSANGARYRVRTTQGTAILPCYA